MTDIHYVVPNGLLIRDTPAAKRMYAEQQKITKYFPQFGMYRDQGHLYSRGVLRTSVGNTYGVSVIPSDDYPHSIPVVLPLGWKAEGPHIYVGGNLCFMKPEQWRSFYSLAFVIARSAMWLNKFEVYKARGRWPGNEQAH